MIKELLSLDEGKTLEFKENGQSLAKILQTIIAFANTAGGRILIGVKDRTKQVVGLEDPIKESERMANAMADSISPLLLPDIEFYTFRKKTVLVICVPHSIGPYYLKSKGIERGTYVRMGSTNRLADSETLAELRRLAENVSYDELPHILSNEKDLDLEFILKLFKIAGKKIDKSKLKNMGMMTTYLSKHYPSYGGLLLFGKNRLKIFPDAFLKCARFSGTNRATILDHVEIEDYLTEAVDLALKFIERNIKKKAIIGRLARVDQFEYPMVALREALINAIVHSDYSIKGCTTQIAIFDDRIEITNPGGLPYGLTLEKALNGVSRIRNRVIAKVFKEIHYIEQWGSGIQRIIEECEKKGLVSPKFEELNNQFRVTISREKLMPMELSAWEKQLIDHLKKAKEVKVRTAMELWGVAERTARYRLKKMTELGLIKRIATAEKDPQAVYVLP